MVVVFTSIEDGGILQLANQVTQTLDRLGYACRLYVPSAAEPLCAAQLKEQLAVYDLPKTINPYHKGLRKLADEILALHPELVLVVDDAIRSNLLLHALGKQVKTAVIVHDVTPHLQQYTLRKLAVETVRCLYRLPAFSAAHRVVLLSGHSETLFARRYGRFVGKSTVLPLGAHVIPSQEQLPAEMQGCAHQPFALFFGRIDAYKGVERLIQAHLMAKTHPEYTTNLVIAGKNMMDKPVLVQEDTSIRWIDRYLSDGEMQWLFRHCRFVVLPYHEASQSGVLPMAYFYGKPVLVSAIDGLQELVLPGCTGEIFEDDRELTEKLLRYGSAQAELPEKDQILAHYAAAYNWQENLRQLMTQMK